MRLVSKLRSAAFLCAIPNMVFAATVENAAIFPAKPIHLIVPYPAGGGADYWGQLVGKKLGEALGRQVIIDNVPGAGGNKGTEAASKAPPDGYTLLLGSVGPLVVHPFTYEKLAFRAEKDFEPIALLESSPILLVAATSVKDSSAIELIADARANPGKFSYASNGNGSPEQIAGEIFKQRLGLDIRHLPFEGAGPARKAVLANEASLMFDPCKGALPAIRGNKETALAVAAPARLPDFPQVPTFLEVGVPNYELRIWTGILAPAGTPNAIVAKLSRAIKSILSGPDIREEIAREGGEGGKTSPHQFARFIESERVHWRRLVQESGITKVADARTANKFTAFKGDVLADDSR
jgi:tripartite-type tricarboxylate transporter receptor subunit TctC